MINIIRNQSFLAVIIVSLFVGLNSIDGKAQNLKSAVFGSVFNSVEARPIFNANAGLVSFPIGLGLTGESEVYGHIFWLVEASHFRLGSRTLSRDNGFYANDLQFERTHLFSTQIDGGLRYYNDAFGNSWYGGARLGFSRLDAAYNFDQANISEISYIVPVALEAGYRFVVHEQITVRTGARVVNNYLLSQQFDVDADKESQFALEARHANLQSILDVGVAYFF
ncbi:MAG: hypothetical protein R3B45_10235 [Bdellovibrionota bacterium]